MTRAARQLLPTLAAALTSFAAAQTPMSYGQTVTSSLAASQVASFQFSGTAGERVLVRATGTTNPTSFDPCVDVRRPSGQRLGNACSTSIHNQVYVTLLDTGPHQILVTDSPTSGGNTASGSFTLIAERLAPTASANAIPLTFDAPPITAAISPTGDVDVYTFTARQGAALRLTATGTSNPTSFDPCVYLYSPSGANVQNACTTSVQNVLNHTTTTAGTYVVVIGDRPTSAGGMTSGSYTLELDCLASNCASTASYTTFGAGCNGSAGVPTLAPQNGSLPVIGAPFTIDVTNLPFFGVAAIYTGLSNSAWGPIPLPFTLDHLGMTGCTAWIRPDAGDPLLNNGGTAVHVLNIPLDPGLIGVSFFQQAVVFDQSANTAGFTASNAGSGVIG